MTKTCTRCGEEKPLDDFPPRGLKRHSFCGDCKRIYDRKFHTNRNVEAKQKKLELQKKRIQEKWDIVNEYKRFHPCVDCGFSNPVALDFDHVIGEKVNHVSQMIQDDASIDRIMEEIAKCEVRCANCHRIVTHQRRINLGIAQ